MGKMHADEPDVDESLVHRLIASQFPDWAGLPVAPVVPVGTSNAMYRLGEDLVVRLPRTAGAADDVEKEQRWLPRLAPSLPVPVPLPLGKGAPAEGYPWHWSVFRWLDGANPVLGEAVEFGLLAADLADFVTALHLIDPADGPPSFRSEPLAARDASTRAASRSRTRPWTPARRSPCGRRRCGPPRRPARPSGSTRTCNRATCCSPTDGSAPSSTSAAWGWAMPPSTSSRRGTCSRRTRAGLPYGTGRR